MTGHKFKGPSVLFLIILVLLIILAINSQVLAQSSVPGSQREESHDNQGQSTDSSSSVRSINPTNSVYTATFHLPLILRPDVLQPPWLKHVNSFRIASQLPQLQEDTNWSNSDWLHSRYMVKNDYVGHSQTIGNEWYTAEGDTAARNGNVFVSSWSGTTDITAINFWMTAPFHAVSILDPHLSTTGYGSYREELGLWRMGATLDVLRGRGSLPPTVTFPIMFPGSGGETQLLTYNGGEFPDPLSSCPGYTPPTGSPIIVQIGPGNETPIVSSHEFRIVGGPILEHCQYDETNYVNPNGQEQLTGRLVLGNRDAIVLMPRQPLEPGKDYQVLLTVNGEAIQWIFSVASSSSSYNPTFEGRFTSSVPR